MPLIASAREHPFGSDELFAWSTDAAGRLRATDEVFARLTGYSVGEEVGQARELLVPGATYTMLLAKDGGYVWALIVVAAVAGGLVGVGCKPLAASFAAGRELRASRLAGEDAGGFAAFMRAALVEEVAVRDPQVPRGGVSVARDAGALLASLGGRLAGYGALSSALRRKSGFVEELAESIRLFSLNAILAAHRVADAAAIGAVAGLMQTRSDAAVPDILALGGEIEPVVTALEEAGFQVAAGRLQCEALGRVSGVSDALADSLDAVAVASAALETALDRLATVSRTVEDHLKTLRFLELQGRIEAARADDTEHVRTLFEEVGRQVRVAGEELREFAALGERWGSDDAAVARRLAAALRAG